MATTATGHLRLGRMARSVIGDGEPLHWYPSGDPESGGGYSVATFADPVPIRGRIRPGAIDSNVITTLGDESTADYHLITASGHGVAEDDHIKRPNATPGADAHLSAEAGGFRVSQPMACETTGIAVYALDADDRGVAEVPVGTEPESGWPTTRDAVLAASDGHTIAGSDS